jgi:hypothetical protein
VAFGLEIDEPDRDDTGAVQQRAPLRYRMLTAEGTG